MCEVLKINKKYDVTNDQLSDLVEIHEGVFDFQFTSGFWNRCISVSPIDPSTMQHVNITINENRNREKGVDT